MQQKLSNEELMMIYSLLRAIEEGLINTTFIWQAEQLGEFMKALLGIVTRPLFYF
jgi:hypothetical protein